MLEAARRRFEGDIGRGLVDIRDSDLRREYPPEPASTTLSIPEEARAMGRRGRAKMRDGFGLDAILRRHDELYAQALGTGRAALARST